MRSALALSHIYASANISIYLLARRDIDYRTIVEIDAIDFAQYVASKPQFHNRNCLEGRRDTFRQNLIELLGSLVERGLYLRRDLCHGVHQRVVRVVRRQRFSILDSV